MNTKTISALSAFAAVAVSLLTAGQAHANECPLPVVGETHMLRAFNSGDYVQDQGGEARTDALDDPADARFELVPGLLDPTKVSLRLASDPTRYLAVADQYVALSVLVDDGSLNFKRYATFEIVPGLLTGDCNYTGVSLRWVYAHQLGQDYYVTSNTNDTRLVMRPEGVQFTTPAGQTFAVDFEEHTGPSCEP